MLEEIVERLPKFDLARPLSVVVQNDTNYYLSWLVDGTSLQDVERNQAYEVYRDTARYLGLILKQLKSDKGSRDMKSIIESRVNGGTSIYLKNIIDQWSFIWDHIPLDYVFDKDAHQLNWIVSDEGDIFAIDLTDKGTVPYTFDLVKLMGTSRFLEDKPEFKKELIKEYATYRGISIPSDFEKEYLNSTIVMALNYHVLGLDKKYEGIFLRNALDSVSKLVESSPPYISKKYEKIKYNLGLLVDHQ